MPVRTIAVPFGRPATEALAEVVADAQGADAFAPVTVLVPSNVAGITVRRLLGSAELGAATGVVNLTVSTPHQFAAHVGGARAAVSGVPLSNPVLAAAVRRALIERPGALAPVADHPATEHAVLRIYGELSRLEPAGLARLRDQGRPITRDLVALVDAVRDRLDGFFDEDDVADAARAAVDSGEAPDLGTVVLHLLGALTPAHERLLDAVARRFEVVVVVGCTGIEAADRALRPPRIAAVDRATHPFAPAPVTGIISVADTDEEVRAAVRLVAGRVDEGVPLHRIAVVYPTDQPYARTLQEQLDSAGVAWNGPSTARLAHTAAGRTLTRFLGLAAADLGREAVIDLVGGAPVRDRDGRLAPGAVWDRLSREAGVIGGAADWPAKLDAFAGRLRADLDTAVAADSVGRRVHIERDQRALASLRAFVAALGDRATPPTGATWAERAAWAEAALTDLLGDESRRVRWPEAEITAADAVAAALERVSVLDPVDPDPSAEVFARAVADELDSPLGRRGRVGVGVLLAPLAAAPGLDVDIVIALGLAEGTCPSPRHEDSLLPDGDRSLAAGDLALRAERVDLDHARLLAALAAGRRERVLVHPRGDHRSGRGRLPSRWLVEAAGRLVDAELHGSDMAGLAHPAITRIESYVAGLTASSAEASTHDLDVRTLAVRPDGADLGPLAEVDGLRAGLDMVASRRSPAFTRFDGNLAGVDLPSPVEGSPLSATRVETWASCPFRYYLGYVLGLGRVERPERITHIGALDRGSLVHEVLERFGREVLERPATTRPAPSEPWSAADRHRLLEIAGEVCDEYEARGVTGRPLLWRLTRHDLIDDFARFLTEDDGLRAELGTTLEAVEVPFGLDGAAPVELTLSDGRVARFRGLIDRIDRRADGDAVVLDYKTNRVNRPSPYLELADDPVVRGTKVQLALYAEAVQQHHGATCPTSSYWFATSAGAFATIGYPYTTERRRRFREVVDHAVGDIEAGVFPARPGEVDGYRGTHSNCRWCDFDHLCPRDRDERWADIVDDPAIAAYVALAEPAPDQTDDAEASP